MGRNVSNSSLIRALKKLDFEVVRVSQKGDHATLKHKKSGLIVTALLRKGDVPPSLFRAIATQIENYNILPKGEFAKMVR
jgi:predicted RNA binding protein YcfA (HicA-like mRNA interferase family)